MTSDADDRAHLLCSECEHPVWVDSNRPPKEDPHRCLCDEPPSGWRMLTREEIMDRAGEFL